MKGPMLILTLAAFMAPALAIAQDGCTHNRLKTAEISCAEGQVWDAKAQSCVLLDS